MKLFIVIMFILTLVGVTSIVIAQEPAPAFRREEVKIGVVVSGENEISAAVKTAVRNSFSERFALASTKEYATRIIDITLNNFSVKPERKTRTKTVYSGEGKNRKARKVTESYTWYQASVTVRVDVLDKQGNLLKANLFYDSNIKSGGGENRSKEITNLVYSLAGKIFPKYQKEFPVEARIIAKEENLVTLDAGRNMGFAKGIRLQAYIDGTKIGLLEAETVTGNMTKAKIVRGADSVTIGASVKEKIYPEPFGVFLTYSAFPIDAEINRKYEITKEYRLWARTGELVDFTTQPLNSAALYRLSVAYLERNGGGGDVGIGLLSIQNGRKGIKIDANLLGRKEVVAELFEFYGRAGIGLILMKQDWAWFPDSNECLTNDEGKTYCITDISGTVTGGAFGGHGAIGLKLNLTPRLSLTGDLGYSYYKFGDWDIYEDLNQNDKHDTGESFDIPDDWLKYRSIKINAATLRAGLVIGF